MVTTATTIELGAMAALQAVAHSERAFSIPGFLSVGECDELIVLAEREGFEAAGVRTAGGPKAMPLVRNNDRVLVESAVWVALLWQRL